MSQRPPTGRNHPPREFVDASLPPPWSPYDLRNLRAELRSDDRPGAPRWDLVVVGAGITGAGVARDAAMRGMRVLVLEATDVAFGTSSRSSRLIHGGVRYLEQGDLRLVREALRERARAHETAPHLVARARFLFPAHTGDRLPLWKLRVGLTLYDMLDAYRGVPHEHLTAEAACTREPTLIPNGLTGAVAYEDAVTDDARLTLTVLQSARAHGARVLTYCPVTAIARAGAHLKVLTSEFHLTTHACVVATGPWTGARLLGAPGQDLLTLSKGVHVVVRHSDVPVRRPVVIQMKHQRRILFAVPWGTRTYLGTTDTAYQGDPGASGVTVADEAQILAIVSRVLRAPTLAPERIVSAWSGVRPLVRPEGAPPKDTAEFSRSHRLVEGESGAVAVVGGKLTTYRSMAEEVVDHVRARLPPERAQVLSPCVTASFPLVPGRPLSALELAADPLLRDLEPRHGPTARRLAARCHEDPALASRLVPDLPYRRVEVHQALEAEGCTHLHDILRRRLPLALTDLRLGGAVAHSIATLLVEARGGTAGDVAEEVERYVQAVQLETRRRPLP